MFWCAETTLSSILDGLKCKLSGTPLKLTVQDESFLMEALPIYKSPDFDASRPLRVSFSGQPAIDSGGPRWEFFTKLFHEISTSNGSTVPVLFEGPEGRLMPVYSAIIVYSGIMKSVGKIIAHSIAQCGVGFPMLSPVCYWYLITEDVSKAGYANSSDVSNIE